MDANDENKRKLASRIVIISSVLLCASASGLFTMEGASFMRGGIIGKFPEFVWVIWGVAWGAICGGVIAYFLIKALLRRRKVLYGLLYGLGAGFIIGLVNGLLTNTVGFGIIIGIVLGPVPGLILACIFLNLTVYKPE